MNLSAKLKQLRAEKQITQGDLADKLHVSRTLISSWETGRSYPDLQTIVEISNYYEISLDYLLREDIDMVQKLNFDFLSKKKFKVLKILLPIVIVIAVFAIWYNVASWQGQISAMNPENVKILKIKKVAIPPRIVDGKKVEKDFMYDVYLKMSDPFHDYDVENTGANSYGKYYAVDVSFQVRNSINIFNNLSNKNKTRHFKIYSFAAQKITNNSRESSYNIGKDIYLVGENPKERIKLISSSNNE